MDMSTFDNLSEETKAQLVAAKTPEEILEIAKREGIKLSEEDLEAISGGSHWCFQACDVC